MLKKIFVGAAALSLLAGAATAGDSTGLSGATIAIGTTNSPGFLSGEIKADGYVPGDDFSYVPTGESSSSTTIWRNEFMVYVISADEAYYTGDGGANVSSLNTATENSFSSTASTISSEVAYGTTGITGALEASVTNPAGGDDRAAITWEWTYSNSTGSAEDIRVVWFFDADLYTNGSFNNERVAVTNDVDGYTELSQPVFALGHGTTDLDLNGGYVVDSDIAPEKWFGVMSGGSSSYWDTVGAYASNGVQTANQIEDSVDGTIEDDSEPDFLGDSDLDIGVAQQWTLTVPAGGSVTLTCVATAGVNDTVGAGEFSPPASVESWQVYDR